MNSLFLFYNYFAQKSSSLGLMINERIMEKKIPIGRAVNKLAIHIERKWCQSEKSLRLIVVTMAMIDSMITAMHRPKMTFICTVEISGNNARNILLISKAITPPIGAMQMTQSAKELSQARRKLSPKPRLFQVMTKVSVPPITATILKMTNIFLKFLSIYLSILNNSSAV